MVLPLFYLQKGIGDKALGEYTPNPDSKQRAVLVVAGSNLFCKLRPTKEVLQGFHGSLFLQSLECNKRTLCFKGVDLEEEEEQSQKSLCPFFCLFPMLKESAILI